MLKRFLSAALALTLTASLLFAQEASQLTEAQAEAKAAQFLKLYQTRLTPEVQQAIRDSNAELEALSLKYPKNASLHFAAALSTADDEKSALAHTAAAYVLAPNNAQYALFYATRLKQIGRPLESLPVLRALCKAHPQTTQFRIVLADSLARVQRYQEALDIFLPFTALNPEPPVPSTDYATVLLCAGTCALYLGEHDNAIRLLKKADNYYPNAAGINDMLGYAYLKNNQPALARECFEKVLKINPSVPLSLYGMGLLEKSTNPTKAQDYFNQALKSSLAYKNHTRDGQKLFLLSLISTELGNTQQAMQYQEQAKALHITFDAPIANPKNTPATQPTR
jgi:tetratricopeptide (TPR) repeat protein